MDLDRESQPGEAPGRTLASKRVLVTGAGGFVGANLVRGLLTKDCDIHLLLRPGTSSWRLRGLPDRLTVHLADLRDRDAVRGVTAAVQPRVVYHLAAWGAYPWQTDVSQIIAATIMGTAHLLEALTSSGVERVIMTGSSAEYGRKLASMKETDPLQPLTVYAAAKAAASLLCGAVAHHYALPILNLRLFSVYGYFEEPARLIPTAIARCLDGQPIDLTAETVRHDFVFVDDVIEACLRAAEAPRGAGEVVNIGFGRQFSNRRVVSLVLALVGRSVPIREGGYEARAWDNSCWVADNRKAMDLLGWRPRHSLREGLAKTIHWIERHRDLYPAAPA